MTNPEVSNPLQFQFSPRLKLFCFTLIFIGLVTFIMQFFVPWHWEGGSHSSGVDNPTEAHQINPRLFLSIHLALLVFLPISLGGIYFVALAHITGSVWNITLRRLAEHFFSYLPVILLMMAIVFWGAGDVFHHWVHAPPDDHLIQKKTPWLNLSSFVLRNTALVVAWFFFALIFRRRSLLQDADGSLSHTRFMFRLSAVFLIFFALSYSVNSWDLSMSLEPHWFSTIWAIYIFSGMALSVYAALVLWVWYLKREGYYGNDYLNENHIHDLGKFLWGHSLFWAYIAVSQYLLIWYGAIPEETQFFKTRTEEGWYYVSFGLPIIRFVIPFLLLMRRGAKRKINYLALVSLLILVGQVWDMYWIAYPTLAKGHFVWFSWQEVGALLAASGGFIYVTAMGLQKYSLIPSKDPRLSRCLDFHQ